MARTTRQRRKMANTTDAPTSASSLLSSTTSTPFDGSSVSVTYPTESYSFNYSGLANLGGYSLDDLNYTELWVDVWNGTEASNVTERLNATVLPPGGYCDEWESAQHKLFQVILVPINHVYLNYYHRARKQRTKLQATQPCVTHPHPTQTLRF